MNPGSLRLRTAVILGSLLLAVFGIGASLGLILISSYLHEAAQGIKAAVDSIAASEELQINLLDHNREHLLFDHTGNSVHANRRDDAAVRLERGADTIIMHVSTDAERALVADVRNLIRQYVAEMREADRSENQNAIQAYVSGAATLDTVANRLRELISLNQVQAQALYESIDRQDRVADILGISIAATLLGIVFALVFGVRSVIYRPLLDLREAVKSFGDGDFKARAEPHGPQDIREIADVFNDMAAKLERGRSDQLRFLAAVAHDLRTPLSAIRMSMDLVTSSLPDSYDEIREMAEIVRRQSEHLDRMTGDLLDRSRIEAGLFELRLEDYDLRRLVDDVVRLQQTTTSMHRLKLHLPEEPVMCHCDRVRLGQVLNNLVGNAIKYSPHGGVVTIYVARRGDLATVAISDQGMGISPEDRARIFEPFHRSRATKETIPGVGLGLAVSKRLVEAHEGTIQVECEAGCGSTFTVTLPALADPERRAALPDDNALRARRDPSGQPLAH